MNSEPVAIAAAVRAVIYVAILFGLHVSTDQLAAIVIAVEAVSAVFVRSRVTPVPTAADHAGAE